jgi:hypothetical protein
MRNKFFLTFFLIIVLTLSSVNARDFTPQGNILGRNRYNTTGFVEHYSSYLCLNISGTKTCINDWDSVNGTAGSGDITAVNTPDDWLSGGATSGAVNLLFNESYLNDSEKTFNFIAANISGKIDNSQIDNLAWQKLRNYPAPCKENQTFQLADTLVCIEIANISTNAIYNYSDSDTQLTEQQVKDFINDTDGYNINTTGNSATCTLAATATTWDGETSQANLNVNNSQTADSLYTNGANCDAGSYPLGVDAQGAVEGCTDATTEIDSAISTHAGVSDAHHTKTVDLDTNTTSIAFTGTSTKTLTLQQDDQGDLTAQFTDIDTTYSAGNGIALATTTFSVAGNTCLDQDSDGLSVTADCIGNTQLEFDTGQALTTTSEVTFKNVTSKEFVGLNNTGETVMNEYWNGTCWVKEMNWGAKDVWCPN